jgi:hypothetical protein
MSTERRAADITIQCFFTLDHMMRPRGSSLPPPLEIGRRARRAFDTIALPTCFPAVERTLDAAQSTSPRPSAPWPAEHFVITPWRRQARPVARTRPKTTFAHAVASSHCSRLCTHAPFPSPHPAALLPRVRTPRSWPSVAVSAPSSSFSPLVALSLSQRKGLSTNKPALRIPKL